MEEEKKEKFVLTKGQKFLLKIISKIAGSWWGVILHTAWFTVWLIYHFDINILTLAVSLEAIFIGIFLLMASNEAEKDRDRREAASQRMEKDIINKILDLEEKINRQQQQILSLLVRNDDGDEEGEKKMLPK